MFMSRYTEAPAERQQAQEALPKAAAAAEARIVIQHNWLLPANYDPQRLRTCENQEKNG
jgi:hypothetical protein